MNIYASPVSEWGNPLRSFPLGKSMASLFLVPPEGYLIPLLEQRPVLSGIDFVVALPDGFVDFRTIPYRTRFGLKTPRLEETPDEKITNNMIPRVLRDISGLPVKTLAALAHVSRNAYNKWLDDKGVSDEHIIRLTELLNTFRTIYDLHGPNLKEFLETAGPVGRPIDLLIADNNEVVIGLALLAPFKMKPLSETLSKLRNLSALRAGWDSYDALAPNSNAILHAENWIVRLFQKVVDSGLPWLQPNVTADANGDVVFEWWRGKKKLTVYIGDVSAEYVQVWGTDIHSEMSDGDAESISTCQVLWLWLTK